MLAVPEQAIVAAPAVPARAPFKNRATRGVVASKARKFTKNCLLCGEHGCVTSKCPLRNRLDFLEQEALKTALVASKFPPMSSKTMRVGSKTTPVGSKTAPVCSAPVGSKPTLVGSITTPVGSKTMPVTSKTTPVDSKTPPVDSKTAPVGSKTTTLGSKTMLVGSKTTQPLPAPLHVSNKHELRQSNMSR